jgi:hypothetical protein
MKGTKSQQPYVLGAVDFSDVEPNPPIGYVTPDVFGWPPHPAHEYFED